MVDNRKVYIECSEEDETDNDGSDNPSAPKLSKKPQLVHCGLCHASFGRQDHLKRHMQCLHSSFTFCKCPVCNKQFANEAAVKRHITASHSQSTTFRCRVCQTVFSCFIKLCKHETTHVLGRHKCPECSAQFKRRDHMLRHVKSQHLNQHEVCPHCGQTLRRKDHLTKHLREKHSVVEPAAEDGERQPSTEGAIYVEIMDSDLD